MRKLRNFVSEYVPELAIWLKCIVLAVIALDHMYGSGIDGHSRLETYIGLIWTLTLSEAFMVTLLASSFYVWTEWAKPAYKAIISQRENSAG